jgi:hypothetical protein
MVVFNPSYKTKDGMFEIQTNIDLKNIKEEDKKDGEVLMSYNNDTGRYCRMPLRFSPRLKKYYILYNRSNRKTKKYFIKDLEEIKDGL